MKYYTKENTNVPMAFHALHTYVRLPLTVIASVIAIIKGMTQGYELAWIDIFINAVFMSLAVISIIGLCKQTRWGFITNMVVLSLDVLYISAHSYLYITYLGTSLHSKMIIWEMLAIFYYWKRVKLFVNSKTNQEDVEPTNESITYSEPCSDINSIKVNIITAHSGVMTKNIQKSDFDKKYIGYICDGDVAYAIETVKGSKRIITYMTLREWQKALKQSSESIGNKVLTYITNSAAFIIIIPALICICSIVSGLFIGIAFSS